MASQTIGGQRWPDGTTVSVYPAAAQPDPSRQPSGPATTTGTVSSGAVTFTGLADAVPYIAWALNAGVRFATPRAGPAGGVPDRDRILSLEVGPLGTIGAVTYDAAGNLTQITEAGVTTTYTYDASGNALTEARAGRTRTFSYDVNGALTGATVS